MRFAPALPGPVRSALTAYRALAEAFGARADGWANQYTGLGTNRDKTTTATFCPTDILSPQELCTLFHTDDIAYRIVTARPKEMLRAGYRIIAKDPAVAKELREAADKLKVDQEVLKGMILGSLYGGAATVLGVNDRRTSDRPLGDNIKEVEWLVTLDRRYVYPQKYYGENGPLGVGYNEPETYVVSAPLQPIRLDVHESRIIRWEGAMTDDQVRRQLGGWTMSNLQRAYETMRLFGTTFQSVGHLVQDASQGVYKIQGLMDMIAHDRPALEARMALVDMSRSVTRAIMCDAEIEDFTRVSTSFTGLPEILDRVMMRLSAATEIPVTLLMGRSAAGMNSTGDSDFRAYYASCASEQTQKLLPVLMKIYRLLASAAGHDPEEVSIEFNPLWELDDAQTSLIEKNDADRDCALISNGVWLPEEVALRMRRGRRGSSDTEIDIPAREASMAIELKLMKDPAIHKANAMPAPAGGSSGPGSGGGKQPKGGVDQPGPRTSKVAA